MILVDNEKHSSIFWNDVDFCKLVFGKGIRLLFAFYFIINMVFGYFSVSFRITFDLVLTFWKNVSFIVPEASFEPSRCVCSALGFKLKDLFLLLGGITYFIFLLSSVFDVSLII